MVDTGARSGARPADMVDSGEIAEYDPIATDRALLRLVTDWEGFVHSAEEGPMKKPRKPTRAGRRADDGTFVAAVERLTGRDPSKGRPGRARIGAV